MPEEMMKKEDVDALIESLPLEEPDGSLSLRKYKGFWYHELDLPTLIASRQRCRPRDTDVILVSPPKCGTTWLKALAFATVNRKSYRPSSPDHPLLSKHPQDCAPFIEWTADFSQLESVPPPRLLSTHMAYSLLPETTESSGCRMVFICRDPKDQLVSSWYFFVKERQRAVTAGKADVEMVSLSRMLEMFCKGVSIYGPTWDHVLEYWRASLERPSKVLFLHYEDVQRDAAGSLKRLAEFIGLPFSEEEEREGMVEDIVKLCSFENLSGVDENKGDGHIEILGMRGPRKKTFFRTGKVGDWKNHLTTEMAAKVDAIFQDKLAGSGLDLGGTDSSSDTH